MLSKVAFRKKSSEDSAASKVGGGMAGRRDTDERDQHEQGTREPGMSQQDKSQQGMNERRLTDPRAIRALAHPVRLALLEALAHAGTLTATQASEILGESPANCAFHLRTLAKYGYVEEAGGGRGRERPWRRVHEALRISSDVADPAAAQASDDLSEFLMDILLTRARAAMARRGSWPSQWQHTGLGQLQVMTYLTPEEARQLSEETHKLYARFDDRADHPERRPPGAMPVEILRLSYLLTHLAGYPSKAASDRPATGPAGEPGTSEN
jgi:DNA-binding transcriptional ArsR family regulator